METTNQPQPAQTTTVEIPLETVAAPNPPAPQPAPNLPPPEPVTNLPVPQPVASPPAPQPVANPPAPQPATNISPAPQPVANPPPPQPVTNLPPPPPQPLPNPPAAQPVANPPAYQTFSNVPTPQPVNNIPAPQPVTNIPAPQPVTNIPVPDPVPNLPAPETLVNFPASEDVAALLSDVSKPPDDMSKEPYLNNRHNGMSTSNNTYAMPDIEEKSPFLDKEIEFIDPTDNKEEQKDNAAPAMEDMNEDEFWTDEEDNSESDELKKSANAVARLIMAIQTAVKITCTKIREITQGNLIKVTAFLCYCVYFGIAMNYEFGSESSHRLLVCTILGLFIMFWDYIYAGGCFVAKRLYGGDRLSPQHVFIMMKVRVVIRWFFYVALAAVMIYVLVEEGRSKPENLRSVPGLFIFILILVLLCPCPHMINWHTIYWAIGLQFLFALAVLRSETGRDCILWTQSRLDEFFNCAKAGSTLLFGNTYRDHYMIFGALPILFFANSALTILYYLGAIQFIVKVIGGFLNFVLETSPVESTAVAAGMFMEGIASLLIFRAYLKYLSKSQLFLVITSVFASLGGAYLAMLSGMGISLEYLISAMVISAPATFAVCKLMVPETKWTKEKDRGRQVHHGSSEEEKNQYNNVLEAGQTGAVMILNLVATVAITVFTFFSFIDWINNTLTWFGDRVGIEKLTIELISSYVLYPVALMMGIEPDDCRSVGMLLGYRLGMNNMVGFMQLRRLQANKMIYNMYMLKTNFTGPVTHDGDDMFLVYMNKTLVRGFMSDRSEAVATYVLSGFSSMLAVVMIMGILCTLVPTRKAWISSMVLPALIAGNVANCMTGCFASIFYEE